MQDRNPANGRLWDAARNPQADPRLPRAIHVPITRINSQVLACARAGDQLVIWRLDRLGRSLKDLIGQMANLEQHGIELVSLQESIDTLMPTGKALFQICGVFAEFECNLISERTQAGLAAAPRQFTILSCRWRRQARKGRGK